MFRLGMRAPWSAPRTLSCEGRCLRKDKWTSVTFNPSRTPTAAVRFASTAVGASTDIVTRLKIALFGTSLVLGAGLIYFYITDTRASAHRWLVVPALRLVYPDPEDAHHAGNSALKTLWQFGLYPRERGNPDEAGDLKVEVFGHTLANPIATSAGIDKHADILSPLFAIGPAIVEIGGTTPMPQDGNERPRVFRLPSQRAFINRYGLNSEGADHVAMRLRQRVREFAYSRGLGYDASAEQFVLDGHAGVPPGSLMNGKLLAVNIAKNKFTPENDVDAVEKDYVYCVERLAPYADILVVNVSSPNTPGLRSLQQTGPLTKILSGVVQAAKQTERKTKPAAVMVKVSPDEDSEEQIAGICQAVWEAGVDGVIVGNTTNRRPGPMPSLRPLSPLEEQTLLEQGGFSGPHLFERTVALVKRYKKLLDRRPLPPTQYATSHAESEKKANEIKGSLRENEKRHDASTNTPSRKPADSVQSSADTGIIALRPPPAEEQSHSKPLLFNPPTERLLDQSSHKQNKLRSTEESSEQRPAREEQTAPADQAKVIFATGGITDGKQALEVLNAGASVAMIYTALVYGGAGTISRIKGEMRDEITAGKKTKKKAIPS
jgi:dihydroorotate dehydrogenase